MKKVFLNSLVIVFYCYYENGSFLDKIKSLFLRKKSKDKARVLSIKVTLKKWKNRAFFKVLRKYASFYYDSTQNLS